MHDAQKILNVAREIVKQALLEYWLHEVQRRQKR
jgi:hypothetical protein